MSRKLCLIGKRFGRLLVVEDVGRTKKQQVLWKCVCICGNEVVVCGQSLREGSTKSCGCLQKEKVSKAHRMDLQGHRFGRLLVYKEIGRDKHRFILWRCLCDCGNVVVVNSNHLRTGNTKSCGCLQKDIMNSRVGKLNPVWKGGISCEPYCDIWLDKDFKESIKQRDGYRCLNPDCKKSDNVLNVHHINYNKKSCGPENLITICRSCNSRANKDREWHKSWYQAIMYMRYGYGQL